MKKYNLDTELKMQNQTFKIKDAVWLRYIKKIDLYCALENNKPLFFISPYFCGVLYSKNFIHIDGLLKPGYFKKFLNQRKILFKNCYFDVLYKNDKELLDVVKDKINNKENIFI